MNLRRVTPRIDFVKDDNRDLLADYHDVLNKWKNYTTLSLNPLVKSAVYGVK